MIKSLWVAGFWLFGAAGPLWAQAAAPVTASPEPTINVSAQGEVNVDPDLATVRLGITTVGSTAAVALAANAEKTAQVVAAMGRLGVARKDTRTSHLGLSAQFAYEAGKAPRLTGYEARHEITIIVRDLPTLGRDLDAAVVAGANEMNGLDFGLSNPMASDDVARLQAVQALTAKATLYAQALGYRRIALITLTELAGSSGPTVGPMPRMALANVTAPEPGQLKVRVQLSAQYAILP